MKNFIPILRADRLREINEYKSKGYIFRNGEDRFYYVRNISVKNVSQLDKQDKGLDPIEYLFQVRNNQQEPRFYIINHDRINNQNESCIYLTLFEIYELLKQLSAKFKTEQIVETLISERTQKWFILYTGLEFEFGFFSKFPFKGYLMIPESNILITYENLFLLIALIQEKSNYLWSISSEENKERYSDGILRLLCCLISTKGNRILSDHGWRYDATKNSYFLEPSFKHSSKYYLTKQEYKNIMEV